MGRGKVAMEFIPQEKTRMTTFQNRKKSLFKKAYELSVLCGIDVCVIVNGFNTTDGRNNRPQIWPEKSEEVRRIITKYKATNSSARRKTRNSDETMPFPLWDSRLDSLSGEESFKLLENLDEKLKMVDQRMDELQTNVGVQLPIVDSSRGEEQIMNGGCFDFASPAEDFFDDFAMNWVNRNFQNDFPIEAMPENQIILPDPYIGLPPLEDCSAPAEARVPSEFCGLPPLPPPSTPSMPFLGQPEMTWSGDCDYPMNYTEQERFCTFDDINSFLYSLD